jgi:transcriptional regulator with XRE-family HTH domain
VGGTGTVENRNSLFMKRLKTLRYESDITQPELAKELGVSKGAVGHWEVGSREPSMEMISNIAKTFKVSVDYLMGVSNFRQENDAIDYLLIKLRESGLVKPNDTIDKKTVDTLISYIAVLQKIKTN